jgi:hypothetical protein
VGISQLNDNSENVSETQEGPQQPGEFSEPDNSGQLSKQCSKPLLSICVPTYNRSKFLRVMLQALLPQVVECGDQVEVWVLDNASPDDTQAVIEESKSLGPFYHVRNDENIGPLRNILKGTCELATGSFVWVLGDHNLMIPGALQYVLETLKANINLNLFYANFRCATYPDQWPPAAVGGHDGQFHYLGNPMLESGVLRNWSDLLRPETALCTQVYAHIVRTRIWQQYWPGKAVDAVYCSALTTYPHTKMLVETSFDSPVYYISTPAITIFNGAQSWGQAQTQMAVYLRGLPDLVESIAKSGLRRDVLKACEREFCLPETTRVLTRNSAGSGFWHVAWHVVRDSRCHFYTWMALWRAFFASDCSLIAHLVNRLVELFRNRQAWWIFNCRPARWLKRFLCSF